LTVHLLLKLLLLLGLHGLLLLFFHLINQALLGLRVVGCLQQASLQLLLRWLHLVLPDEIALKASQWLELLLHLLLLWCASHVIELGLINGLRLLLRNLKESLTLRQLQSGIVFLQDDVLD